MTLEDLKLLNPRTALVILGGALARRKAKDAKLRSQLAIKVDEDAAGESRIDLAIGDADCSASSAWTLRQSADDAYPVIPPKMQTLRKQP